MELSVWKLDNGPWPNVHKRQKSIMNFICIALYIRYKNTIFLVTGLYGSVVYCSISPLVGITYMS